MRAWLFQDCRQQKKLGENNCPWSVGWIDPEGKRRSKKIGSKSIAERFRRKTEGELAAGTYQTECRKIWADFRKEYKATIVTQMASGTRRETLSCLSHFERIVKPNKVAAINTNTIDKYVAKRRSEPSKRRKGLLISPATVNKELRHLKSVLGVANEWGYLSPTPRFRMIKEPKKLPTYVTPEHFALIYRACDTARLPMRLPFAPADWWRGLLTFTYMTGWRIGEPLSLRAADLDLNACTAITRAADNKGSRDELVPLHRVVIDHLRIISSFEPLAFPWPHHRRTLDEEFHRIQRAAGINISCEYDHEHSEACHLYGFHDLRRAFATLNAETLTPDALQALMRHTSYTTTQKYINKSQQLNRKVDNLHVPEVLRKAN